MALEKVVSKLEGEVLECVDVDLVPELQDLEDSQTLGFYSNNGDLLGYVAYSVLDFLFGEPKSLKLQLAKSYREGNGVFRELFSNLKDIAKDNECKRILLQVFDSNTNAIEIYEHYGFKYTGRDFVDEDSRTVLEMALSLRR